MRAIYMERDTKNKPDLFDALRNGRQKSIRIRRELEWERKAGQENAQQSLYVVDGDIESSDSELAKNSDSGTFRIC